MQRIFCGVPRGRQESARSVRPDVAKKSIGRNRRLQYVAMGMGGSEGGGVRGPRHEGEQGEERTDFPACPSPGVTQYCAARKLLEAFACRTVRQHEQHTEAKREEDAGREGGSRRRGRARLQVCPSGREAVREPPGGGSGAGAGGPPAVVLGSVCDAALVLFLDAAGHQSPRGAAGEHRGQGAAALGRAAHGVGHVLESL
jgi:hypothetical protein